jgi:hypothetical protein
MSGNQAVVGQLLRDHQAVIKQSSSSHQAVVRQSSGNHQVVISSYQFLGSEFDQGRHKLLGSLRYSNQSEIVAEMIE